MSEQVDATKDSTGEPTSPNPIQSAVTEFVKKTLDHSKNPHVFGSEQPKELLITSFKIF